MVMLVVERSTETQSAALAVDGKIEGTTFPDLGARSPEWCARVRDFLAARGIALSDLDVFAVGTGPGSFAGVRAAIAFAQGAALGVGRAFTRGIPSPWALAREGERIVVAGDARRGKIWTVAFDGLALARDFALTDPEGLAAAVPDGFSVVTPDAARIGELLARTFGPRYAGGAAPLAASLAEVALARPGALVPEPLPTYLSPPVRVPETPTLTA